MLNSTSLPRALKFSGLLFLLAACTLLTPVPEPTSAPELSPAITSTSAPPLATEMLPVPSSTTRPAASPTALPPGTELPADDSSLVFAVIGDYGVDSSQLDDVAKLIKSWDPQLIITTGDNNYPSGNAETIDQNVGQYFHEFIFPYKGEYGEGSDVNRFFPTLGNHDWDDKNAPQTYTDYFNLPGNERYYDFVWGPVHFFALDSDTREPDGVARSSPQGQWLKEKLAASSAPWKIVYMHHPAYSSGTHGPTLWMQWPFQEWGADAALAGHDHVYERIVRDGFPYFTNGLGGSPNRYVFPVLHPDSVSRFRDDFGAMRVTASETEITFEFITVQGEVVDSYTLNRPAPSGNDPNPAGVGQPAPPVTSLPDPDAAVWQLVANGFNRPLLVTHADDGTGRLFVVEQPGVIRIIQPGVGVLPDPFLAIPGRVGDEGNEQGLLGLAFHPDYAHNGFFYLDYTNTNGMTLLSRFQVSPDNPDVADPSSEQVVLRIQQPFANHNGGHLAFGPDGMLYMAVGDGGSAGDPQGNAQNPDTLLGAILRLDVDADQPYAIPGDNPFRNGGGAPEVWLYGLRNPWRFSFDRLTGDLYIGDVGQNIWEEIDFLPANRPGGVNFGWDYFEGSHSYEGAPPPGLDLVAPIWDYNHGDGSCSVTGGVVYRGQALPDWQGVYVFGDFCSGKVWGLLRDADGNWQHALLFEGGVRISSFGEDESGEVYLVARQGNIYKLVQR